MHKCLICVSRSKIEAPTGSTAKSLHLQSHGSAEVSITGDLEQSCQRDHLGSHELKMKDSMNIQLGIRELEMIVRD